MNITGTGVILAIAGTSFMGVALTGAILMGQNGTYDGALDDEKVAEASTPTVEKAALTPRAVKPKSVFKKAALDPIDEQDTPMAEDLANEIYAANYGVDCQVQYIDGTGVANVSSDVRGMMVVTDFGDAQNPIIMVAGETAPKRAFERCESFISQTYSPQLRPFKVSYTIKPTDGSEPKTATIMVNDGTTQASAASTVKNLALNMGG